jgi:hypothetical protein
MISSRDIIARNVNVRRRQNVIARGHNGHIQRLYFWCMFIDDSNVTIRLLFNQKTGERKCKKDYLRCIGLNITTL